MSHSASAVGEDRVLIDLVDEVARKVQAGEPVDVDAYLAAHPEHADRLRGLLPAVEVLAELGRSASAGEAALSPVAADFDPERGRLGDFRMVREVGRGGMGVVYEAEQVSLGRRVALKVLPFAAALDARQLQRFRTEAQAAAQLHHTNIVPVHAVGCERGVHFYAMQLIDGQTVATLIHELRRLASGHGPAAAPAASTAPVAALATEGATRRPAFFHTVARLRLQAAEALEHAHREGIVHRDIKPANLLVEWRAGGVHPQLWITDFGLARCRSEAGLTLTGDVLGTLRYASPEQALGQRQRVDHRSDLYSLGATLYELLTLEPVHGGRDRHELLRQIATEEPRPLRRRNPAIPADLETVVLKALDKEPEGRYATAQELADDLRRFLEDKPIRAKRPALVPRLRKWSRRHKALVAAAAGVLVVTAVAAVLTTLLVWREKLQADRERDRAREAAAAEQAARQSEARQRRRAEARESFAREAAEIYAQIAERLLANRPHLERQERQLLERVLKFYEELTNEPGTEPVVRLETGRAYRRLGDLQQKLGRAAEAERAYGQALLLLEPLAEQHPTEPRYQYELAGGLNNLGGLLLNTGRPRAAEGPLRRAVSLYEALHQRVRNGPPAEPQDGQLRASWLRETAVRHSTSYRHELAFSHSNLGRVLAATGRPEEAEQAYQRALALQEKLVAEDPAEPDNRGALAITHYQCGELWQAAGRMPKAAAAYGRALALCQKLADDSPAVPAYRQVLAASHDRLGMVFAETGQLPEAEAACRQAINLQQKLAADFPKVPEYRYDLARSQNNLGIMLQLTDRGSEAERSFRQAQAVLEQLTADHPAVPDYRCQLARTCFNLGSLLEVTNRPGEAAKPLRQSQALYETLSAGYPVDLRPEQAGNLNSLALALEKAGLAGEAVQAHRQAVALYERLADEFPKEPDYQSRLGGALANFADLLGNQGKWAEARPLVERAIRCQQAALRQKPDHPPYRHLLRAHYQILADTLAGLGDKEGAARARAQAEALPGRCW